MSDARLLHFIRFLSAITLVLTAAACSGKPPQALSTSTSTSTSVSASTPTSMVSPSPVVVSTPTPEPSKDTTSTPLAPTPTIIPLVDKSVVYQDNFVNPGSGWPAEKFDNYFVGYHAPGYYHFDIRSPNDHLLIPVPGKINFDDITIEAQVFVDTNNTAAEGDFRYGVVFRRSGNQYYAFVISPRSKKWYMLKSSPTALEVLKEGADDSLQGPEVENTLRVDAKGPTFFLHINNRLVAQVSDSDYAQGETGLFVQTLDIVHVHVHFDTITLRQVDIPVMCTIIVERLNVRSGPSTTFDPPIDSLSYGTRFEAQGRSADGQWIRAVVDNGQQGWVNYSDKLLSCTSAVVDLPLILP